MSRNKENVAFQSARRGDNPVYHLGRTPPSDDFFTDSLDTSKIPTPSPSRPLSGKEPAYKPRHAIANTRTLKPAWNVKPKPARTSSSAGEHPQPRLQHSKPAPIRTTRQSPAPRREREAISTPSPPRRAATDLQSPTSESSPPKGLTDVYQRIADEEDLAAQEGEIENEDEDEYTEGSMAASGVHVNGDRALLNQIRQSRSPSSLPGSRRRSPDTHASQANKENRRDDDNTVMSDPTGMSFLRDLTDQALAAKLTPHTIDRAKDRARLERALQKDSPIAFSRAYSRQSGSKTVAPPKKDSPVAFSRAYANSHGKLNAEAVQNAYSEDGGEDQTEAQSTGTAVTEKSEPPPNVPRTWGAKGKVGKEWLHKLHSRDSTPTGEIQKARAPDSSQVDWTAAAAEVPLPSVESSGTTKNISPDPPTPATLHKQPSFDKSKEWDLNDFTGQSLQVSNTPPVRVRSTVLDQLRDMEIQSLEKRAVTTNRLGEIMRKDSRELLRKVSRSPSIGAAKKDVLGVDLSRPKSRDSGADDEGERIPDTPIVIYKGNSIDKKDEKDTPSGRQQPSLVREDSLNTLQKLARAMSESPRPSSSPEDWSLIREAEDSGELPAVSNGDAPQPTLHMELSRKSPKQLADVNATTQGEQVADYAKTPIVTGAWTDTILPETVRTVKRQKDSARHTQTPHVKAGGWVDTPMPISQHQSSALSLNPLEDIPEGLTDGLAGVSSKPTFPAVDDPKQITQRQVDLPKSALTALLDKARRNLNTQGDLALREGNDTMNLGDATIESLEDLLTLDNADLTTLIRMGAELEAREQILKGGPKDEASAEALLLERLGSKLDSLRTNIHDARKGISKLEHQVYHADGHEDQQALGNPNTCNACGSPRKTSESAIMSTPTKVYLAIPLPRFFRDTRRDQWLPRPTPLGWLAFAFSLWYLSESAMCDRYCHPLYADYYDWPEEPEPRFGYALPTMLWRWSGIREFGLVLLGPLWSLFVAFVRILGQAFGLTDGFVDDMPLRSKKLPKPIALDDRIPRPTWGPDLSMMNDEYL